MDLHDRRYQVFISSTFRDLQEERQKVLEAVLEMRAFPSGMEMFPSADDEQWEFIKHEIDSSGYYVLVVAGKYGSLSPAGISYTEQEYDYAIAAKKPVISFLFKTLGDLRGSQLEDVPEQRARLHQFRDKVQAGKLVRFYTNADELKAQVLHALNHAFNFRPQEGWVRARHSRRIEDLEQITELQKQLRNLEAENAHLKFNRDPTERLAQGSDLIERTFPLLATQNQTLPPAETVTISTTWDALVSFLFHGGLPINGTGVSGLSGKLGAFLRFKTRQQFPDAGQWLSDAGVTNFG